VDLSSAPAPSVRAGTRAHPDLDRPRLDHASRACASARAARCSPRPQITDHAGAAEHSSELTVVDPATRRRRPRGGEPAGFIIQLENGFKIYPHGRHGLFGDMKLIADYYKPDLVLIADRRPLREGPAGRAYATKDYSPEFVIPITTARFPVLKGTPQEYIAALGQTTEGVRDQSGDKLEFLQATEKAGERHTVEGLDASKDTGRAIPKRFFGCRPPAAGGRRAVVARHAGHPPSS